MSIDQLLQLDQPLKDGGIRNVNFFNGRLLTSTDLTREQEARQEADARLGLAVGDGVAFGLEVTRDPNLDRPAAPVVRVKAGLAVSRAGQTLRLAADVSVGLTRRFDAPSAACVFVNCTPPKGGTYIAGAGIYLLAIAPAKMGEGRAPTNGLEPLNARCNTDATVDAVRFRLIEINPLRYHDLNVGSKQFRNRLAYRCFGIEAREQGALDPYRVDPPRYGLVDELRAVGLDDRDVPLAIVYWTVGGLQFVDTWAVRRQLVGPDALSGFSFQRDPLKGDDLSSFAFIARRRRLTEAHAMCAQFQQHLADLLAATLVPATLQSVEHFRYLPPFGIVPLQSLPLRGFSETTFFAAVVRRPVAGSGQNTQFIDARLLGPLQEQALGCAPTDLTQGEFVWVYRPWQYVKAALDGRSVQPMVAFASGQLPNLAVARFDLARFDFSNFASCCGDT